jgi:hypothetical protein
MSSAVPWLILAVRNVSRVVIPPLAEHAHARKSNVANVPDTTFSVSP